ncbi:MAG TPA: hypothetical protein VHD61_01960 [Lacunisphaera sp.]|nr:hypothetical protein [Lacunisphaera sp.]
MNKSYIIVPAILLALFGFYYNGALKEMQAKEAARQAQIAADKAAADARKKEIEDKATAEAVKRQQEREAQDAAKEAKKEKDYQDALTALRDEKNKYSTEADKLAKEVADLELQISQSRTERENLNRDALETAKAAELEKIKRRTAEMEIQRMIEMVAKKLNDSSIATPPPPPIAAK